jgi:hypothetical protein
MLRLPPFVAPIRHSAHPCSGSSLAGGFRPSRADFRPEKQPFWLLTKP